MLINAQRGLGRLAMQVLDTGCEITAICGKGKAGCRISVTRWP